MGFFFGAAYLRLAVHRAENRIVPAVCLVNFPWIQHIVEDLIVELITKALFKGFLLD